MNLDRELMHIKGWSFKVFNFKSNYIIIKKDPIMTGFMKARCISSWTDLRSILVCREKAK